MKKLSGYLIVSLAIFMYLIAGNRLLSQTVRIDGNVKGRVFEGVGAVSAGASSRLLIDYPKKYRSDILDYLFKPHFGAGLQHLKVEIGGDINSTTGTEPSHARSRQELTHPKRAYYQRGYEYWLLSEAYQRNPNILLDCLQWGAPGWFKGGFYSQDNADYVVAFIKGAKKYWHVPIRYTGIWNEKPGAGKREWILNHLRPTLDKKGLKDVKIVADDWYTPKWQFADTVAKYESLHNALYALGYHYVDSKVTATALGTGLALWESEAWSQSGEWPNAHMLARQLNMNYIRAQITKTEIWDPIDAFYENLNCAGKGAMTASEPWSGHYEVEPAIWALAHTTQFAEPGWVYLSGGCDTTQKGCTYVTLKKPGNSGDYSIIITSDSLPEVLHFQITNLSTDHLNVWHSDSLHQFMQQKHIVPKDGQFSLKVAPYSIYSLSTTGGQIKGIATHPVPASKAFSINYLEDFENYEVGKTPKYLSDQGGAFEVYQAKAESKTLRQQITGKLILWDTWGPNNPEPFTEFGRFFKDYTVSVDGLIEGKGTIKLFGRVNYFESNKGAHGYCLAVNEKGEWAFSRFLDTLAKGSVPMSANSMHALQLRFDSTVIKGYIDGKQILSIHDTVYKSGYAGIGSAWNHARFDHLKLESIEHQREK
ncbi:MAG TPA: hypothetical protein VL053_04995 [Arachidicoccus sp.]|nr:hypothetical protein [Arachidicoccus sp.]